MSFERELIDQVGGVADAQAVVRGAGLTATGGHLDPSHAWKIATRPDEPAPRCVACGARADEPAGEQPCPMAGGPR